MRVRRPDDRRRRVREAPALFAHHGGDRFRRGSSRQGATLCGLVRSARAEQRNVFVWGCFQEGSDAKAWATGRVALYAAQRQFAGRGKSSTWAATM